MLHVPGYYRLWPGFPTCSATREFGNSSVVRQNHQDDPTTPITQRLPAWHVIGLGYDPFRSPLLGVSLLLSLPPGTEMFQFPGFPVPALCVQTGLTGHDPSRVSPFGDPRIDGSLTPPLGLSQSRTSFIGSRCQGIHRAPITTCRTRCSRSLWSSQGSPDTIVGSACQRQTLVVPGGSIVRPRKRQLPQSCTRCPYDVARSRSLVISPGSDTAHETMLVRR